MAVDVRVVERLLKVIELKAANRTKKQIAAELGVSEGTITNDLRRIRRGDHQSPGADTPVDRRWKEWDFRRQGVPLHEIAQKCGVSERTVISDLQWCRAEVLAEPLKEARQTDLDRVDALIRANWDNAMAGSDKAGRLVLQCLERRANIFGYDEPKRVEVDVNEVDEADRELAAMIREAQAKNAVIAQQLGIPAEPSGEQGS